LPFETAVTIRAGIALGTALLVATSAGLAAPEDVTMRVHHYRNANGVLVTRFAGSTASNAAGEDVEIIGQDCGVRGFRLIAATQTRAGGTWEVENPESQPPWRYTQVLSGITYRARWKDELSAPYTWRLPAPLTALKVPGRPAWRVYTSPPPPGTVKMKGKLVLLQRLRGGRWVTIQRGRLVYKPRLEYGGAFNHEAVFAVRRGWTLRAVLPAASAAPCYLAAVTPRWRS
jgi:hypothetical protein